MTYTLCSIMMNRWIYDESLKTQEPDKGFEQETDKRPVPSDFMLSLF